MTQVILRIFRYKIWLRYPLFRFFNRDMMLERCNGCILLAYRSDQFCRRGL